MDSSKPPLLDPMGAVVYNVSGNTHIVLRLEDA
jgi:hypothetical protein